MTDKGNINDISDMDNNQSRVYLSLLEKSLEKKSGVLTELIDLTQKQEALIINDQIGEDQFYQIINQKSELIKQINELDNGFELLYQRIRDELKSDPVSYKEQIERLKELITVVTDKGVQLQVIERRNKDKIDNFLQVKRKGIKSFKVNSKTASSYYSNVNSLGTDGSYFFDKKK